MWHILEKITEQVTKYTSFLGQLWYILVFVFRLIVVVTIGGSVYGDEQSSFKCSTDVVGCQNICYNEFAKISHMRFWAFQLLAVATPTVFFHFYTLYVNGEIEKLKKAEAQLRAIEEGEDSVSGAPDTGKHIKKMTRRKKSLGNIKLRQIYSGNELKDVIYTNKIHYVYYASVVIRMVLEGLFLYFGYLLFLNMDPECKYNGYCPEHNNPFFFIWMIVPANFKCMGRPGSDVWTACTMHINVHNDKLTGFVPCFVSRPYEKTVFLCYMTVLSAACFLISALELVLITAKRIWRKSRKQPHRKYLYPDRGPRNESVFYGPGPTAPSKNYYEDHWGHNYPSLGLPIRIANRYEDPEKNNFGEKTVRINDEDHNSVKHETNKDEYSDA